ncbi:hypothetical protein EDB85DRAFT_1890878 [Lactarius pseudohatsudake]|nr:hypothetical protein EDB85DRAFT_1890878 [Lactarius pseudohatsudake]
MEGKVAVAKVRSPRSRYFRRAVGRSRSNAEKAGGSTVATWVRVATTQRQIEGQKRKKPRTVMLIDSTSGDKNLRASLDFTLDKSVPAPRRTEDQIIKLLLGIIMAPMCRVAREGNKSENEVTSDRLCDVWEGAQPNTRELPRVKSLLSYEGLGIWGDLTGPDKRTPADCGDEQKSPARQEHASVKGQKGDILKCREPRARNKHGRINL